MSKGVHEKNYFHHSSKHIICHFSILDLCFDNSSKFSHTLVFVNFSHLILFIIYLVYSTHWNLEITVIGIIDFGGVTSSFGVLLI